MSDTVKYDVCVIGSGIGGLSSAALLAKQGFKVLVLEGLDRLGGCCSNYDFDGFKPEVGASFVLQKEMYDKYFELLGLRIEDYIDFKLIDPVYDVVLEGGERYVLPKDFDAMAEVVRAINPAEVANYQRYCSDMRKIVKQQRICLATPLPELKDIFHIKTLLKMMAYRETLATSPLVLGMASRNMDKVIKSYFKDERLQLIFGWENLYAALPVQRANGMFALMTYLGHDGYFYPKGGMIAIPQALARICREFGAEVRLNAPVKRIVVRNGTASGVELKTGELIESRVVLSNAHSRVTYLNLVGPEHLPSWAVKTVRRQPCSIPAPVFYLKLSQSAQARAHITVCLTRRPKFDDFWWEFYDRGLLGRADDGSLLIFNPTFDDPDLAPPGKDVLSTMFIAPYKLKYYNWDEIGDDVIGELTRSLEKRAFPGLSSKIESIEAVMPPKLEQQLNVPEGAFFGLEMNGSNMGPFRPGYRSRLIKNLYLTGQCTNPGGGVAQVLVSGILCSSIMVNHWGRA